MCGIIGVYGQQPEPVDTALRWIAHRGPNGQVVKTLPVAHLGHARLAIIDVTGGQQPISNQDETRWLICNGEIYNHQDLRACYDEYPYKTRSDSEDILAVYAQHKHNTVHHLRGMFAFALLDGDELYVARDRLGIKPLYYALDQTNGLFYFASEIKALQVMGITATIREFPPGHYYTSSRGFVRYYELSTRLTEQSRLGSQATQEAAEQVHQHLQEATRSHLMSDVPLGVFLSGGLDSSIIAGLVKAENVHAPVYTFAVGVPNSQDLLHARRVALHLRTQHFEYTYTPAEMVTVLPEVIYYLESFDPALVRSAVANFFLARLASRHVVVVLSGEGADELYSGYHYLKQLPSPEALQRELVEITTELHNRNLQRFDRMTMAHGLEGRVPFLDHRFVEFSFSLPLDLKLRLDAANAIEKWILRRAFVGMLPQEIVWRTKQKFSEGAGSSHILETLAEREITDEQFTAETLAAFEETGHHIRSKEELYYYRVFRQHYNADVVKLVGFSRSL